MAKKRHIVLSISMLASRNKKEVRRCLDSLKPIMEQIPSELIIVDTSQDASVHALCLEYTDNVVEFVWCNDFSKARNFGLTRAKGEWFLFVDDDEWFVEIQELVDFFCSGEYKKYGCANYIQRNFHDYAGTFYSDNWVSRIIKLRPETRFRSKIHEYLDPQVGKCKNIRAIVNHTGYISKTGADKQKKFDRNYPLLLDMMREEPQRLRWRVQIIQELLGMRMWEEMRRFCAESLDFCRDNADPDDFRDIGTFYAGLLESLVALGDYGTALRTGEAARTDKRVSRLCNVYNSLLLAQLHFREREWEKTEEQLNIYFEGKDYYDEHPDAPELLEGALLVDTTFDNVLVRRAISLRIGCALMRGDTTVLERDYGLLGWGNSVMYVSDDFFPIMVEAFATLDAAPILERAMQDLWNNAESAQKLFAAIEGYHDRDEKLYRRLFRMTARMEGQFWYTWYAKLIVSDWDDADMDYEALFAEFCRHTPDIFITPDILPDIVARHGGSVEEGYLSLPYREWKRQLQAYSEKVSLQDVLVTERELSDMKTREDVRYDFAMLWLARVRAVKSENFSGLEQGLLEYGKHASDMAYKYFRAEILADYPEVLSEELLAGYYIHLASRVPRNSTQEMGYLDLAAKADEALTDVIISYLQQRDAEMEKRARQEKEELRQLEIKIKGEVQKCLDGELYEDALAILEQLAQIKPNDLDVAEMKLRARIGVLTQG